MAENFKRLDFSNKPEFARTMKNMLQVWEDHVLFVYPSPEDISDSINLEGDIAWDEFAVDIALDRGPFFKFFSMDGESAIRTVHNYLRREVPAKAQTHGNADSSIYLVVAEKYPYEGEAYYLVRGVIRGDMSGYAIRYNPEYEATIPQDQFEEFARFDQADGSLPEAYRKRRKQ